MVSSVKRNVKLALDSEANLEAVLSENEKKIYMMFPMFFSNLDELNDERAESEQFEVTGSHVSETADTLLVPEEANNMNDDSQDHDRPMHNSELEDVCVEEHVVNGTQNEKLIDLLEQFVDGSEVGGIIDDSLWEILANHLNTLGPSMDILEWKLVSHYKTLYI